MTARSKGWVCGRLLAGIVGSNPTRGMDVCCGCCDRGFCVGLITRPEESKCGVSECDREASIIRRLWPTRG